MVARGSGGFQDAELLQRGRAVVEANFLGNLAVFDTQHCRSGEPHLPARRRRERADEEVTESGA
jgi:hypothetical protein